LNFGKIIKKRWGNKMETKQDIMDNKGWVISKGTEITIIKTLINPMTKLKEHIIAIDNGTGIKETFPKTIITDGKLQKAQEE
jgi:uncharacterized Zn ribbon protein